ncbi:MAG: leucine-rich repeat domain-containing protein [Bacteroidota bacterium]
MDELLKILFETDDPADVWELDLSYHLIREEWPTPFEQLSGLESLVNLRSLSLSGHLLDEIEGLPELPHLQHLDVSYNNISEIHRFPLLPELTTLNLGHNQLLNLPPGKQVPRLRTLIISGNRLITDLSVLREFPILHTLYLKQLLISDWKPLAALGSLAAVYATPAGPKSLKAMEALQQVRSIDLNLGRFGAVVDLPLLASLKKLTLQYGLQVQEIQDWVQLESLEVLEMKHLGVRSIRGLGVLENLKELRLQNCPDLEIGTLVANRSLKRLYLERVALSQNDRDLLQRANPGLQIIC